MRKHTRHVLSLAALALLAALGVLAGCTAVPGQGLASVTVSVQKQADRATVTYEGPDAIIDITSPSGIGGASAAIGPGTMPAHILMRFHLKGLEHLEFRYGQTVVTLSLPSGGGEAHESVSRPGTAEQPITWTSPYWMATEVRPGYIQVAAPKDFLASGERAFALQWIDFYR
jgi:hypothetical protein